MLLLGLDTYVGVHGGSVRYLADLRDALEDVGVRTSCVVLGQRPEHRDDLVVAARHNDLLLRRLLRYACAAARQLPDADAIDVHFALYGLLPVLMARVLQKPVIVHFQGPWAAEAGSLRGARPSDRLRWTIERVVYRSASEVVVLTEAFARLVHEIYGVPRARVTVIPPAVDLRRFSPGDRRAARRALGLPENGRIVICARRLVPRTGVDILVEAWARRNALQEELLVIAGVGPEEQALRALIERRGVESVRLLGHVADELMPELYRAADLSVVPSRALEGFGLSALESLACGTPVIATRVGGLPEALGPFAAAWVVPPEDPEALADRMSSALGGEAPTGGACRSYAEAFSRGALAERHRAVLHRVGVRRDGRPRVVYLGHSAKLSGGELGLLRLLPRLRSIEPHVILSEDGPLVGRLAEQGVSVEILPMAGAAARFRRGDGPATWFGPAAVAAQYVVQLRALLRLRRPDIVHTVSLKAAIYGGIAGRLVGAPVVWSIRDRIADDYLSAPAVRLVRAAARILPNIVIANSTETARTLGRSSREVRVIPPVAFDKLYTPPRARRSRPFRAAMVGRLVQWKGQDVFLRGFAQAFRGGDETAVIVGDALFGEEEYAAELHALVEELGIAGRVEFTGFCYDVFGPLRDADVLVHASVLPEPFGQVIVQGMAAGVAVIAANAGGPREIIHDGVNGLLVPPGDAGALAERLRTLRDNKELRARLAAAGRSRAADFAPEVIASQTEAVYAELGRRRAGRCRSRTIL